MFKKNYRIGQKNFIGDSGRFLAAMSTLVQFLLLLTFIKLLNQQLPQQLMKGIK